MSEKTKEMEIQEQELIQSDGTESIRARSTFVPRADIYESDESVGLIVDMPGVSDDTIDITLEKDILTIKANTVQEDPQGYSLAFAEYQAGDYARSFRITNQIDRDAIEASYNNGVLYLNLPKSERAKARKIPIKAG